MKTLHKQQNKIYWLLLVILATGFASCKKEDGEAIGTGTPTITRVRTVSKSAINSSLTTTIVTYDAAGVATTVTYPNTTPQTVAMDSTTTDGNLQNMYAIIGTNLGSVTSVSFNGLSVYFNKALGTDTTILVTIPKNAPAGPTQSNVLKVETLYGSATFKFNVLLPPPTVTEVTTLNFNGSSRTTLTGIGLGTVTAVQLTGTTDNATIVSKEDTQLVLSMPSSAVNSATLKITYPGGTVTTKQVFVNLDNTYQFFTDDYGAGWGGNFWGGGAISGEAYVSGTKSLKLTYGKGNWSANGLANWYPGIDYSADWKYLSFYIKGGSKEYTLYITGDKRVGGYGNGDQSFPIVVPANVWTYFKIPTSSVELWKTGANFNNIGFWIKGPDTQDESFFIDDLILVK